MKKHLPAFLLAVIAISLFELLVRGEVLSSSLVPPPSEVLQTLWSLRTDFREAFWESTLNMLVGFACSVVVGLGSAGLFSLSTLLKRAVLPFAVFFQTVPIIAIAPLLVIYFGFGSVTVIVSSFIVSLFPMIANTLVGLESVSPAQKDLFSLYQASKWETLWHLRGPSAFNSIYAGLRVSAGLAIIGAVAGEFVAGGGLGAMIDAARTQQRVDIVFACLILLSLLGLLLMTFLTLLRQVCLQARPWTFPEET